MKKNILMVLVLLEFIITFLLKWFQDKIIDYLFLVSIFADVFILFSFIVLFMILNKNMSKNKSMFECFIILIYILNILVILFFPFRKIKTKLEFDLYMNDRLEIINLVKQQKSIYNDNNIFVLPNEYKKVSTSGKIIIYKNSSEDTMIGFWIFRGMMSGSVQIIYSSGGEDLIMNSNFDIQHIAKLAENWFYVEIK